MNVSTRERTAASCEVATDARGTTWDQYQQAVGVDAQLVIVSRFTPVA